VFRHYDGKKPSLPFLKRDEYVESIQRARYKQIPSNYKALSADEIARVNRDPRGSGLIPTQEPGVRQACVAPYEPYADGNLSADGKSFELTMRAGDRVFGKRAAGFPFNVYLYGTTESTASTAPAQSQPNMISATYAVKEGTSMKESFALSLFSSGKYDIAVHGPNGFFRQFTGGGSDPGIEVRCAYEHATGTGNKLTGNIELTIRHQRGGVQKIEITDNSYHAEPVTKIVHPGRSVRAVLNLGRQHGWYDFSVGINGANDFEQRFAGHVETGKPSYTDPLMGQAV
jgi:phospholipase C